MIILMIFFPYACPLMWQDVVLSLLANTSSSLLTSGDESLLEPSDALRYASTFTALLEYAPEPESPEELQVLLDLKVGGDDKRSIPTTRQTPIKSTISISGLRFSDTRNNRGRSNPKQIKVKTGPYTLACWQPKENYDRHRPVCIRNCEILELPMMFFLLSPHTYRQYPTLISYPQGAILASVTSSYFAMDSTASAAAAGADAVANALVSYAVSLPEPYSWVHKFRYLPSQMGFCESHVVSAQTLN